MKKLLQREAPLVAAGAFNAISARLVEKAGFDAVWLSSFGISVAERALPDANLVTLSEMLQVGRNMVACVDIPVIADCENGYGDINNVIHTVREYELAGISAICIDDNEYPKRCSLYDSPDRRLVSSKQMVSKINAAKDVQRSDEFVIIARTEAIIANLSIDETIRRGLLYLEAGADLLVVHSSSWDQLLQLLKKWNGPPSLVVITTLFPEVDRKDLIDAGFKVIIYANQAIRAALKAMDQVLNNLYQAGCASEVEREVYSLSEVHDLVRYQDLRSNMDCPD